MTQHHIHLGSDYSQNALCGAVTNGDTHSENCSEWHPGCEVCVEKAILLDLCADCIHPKSEHPRDYGNGTSCIHDLDADYDYELERYVKCGGCDCPEFIPMERA